MKYFTHSFVENSFCFIQTKILKDTLKAFDDSKNKQKGVYLNVCIF